MLAAIPARLKQVSPGQTTKKWLVNYSSRITAVEKTPVDRRRENYKMLYGRHRRILFDGKASLT